MKRSDAFKFVSTGEATYQRQRGGDWNKGPRLFQGKPQRCRECGARIEQDMSVIEWIQDANCVYWQTRYFIHAEPCKNA